jgi:methyltransferase (TIGR00027 family)
MDGRSVTAERAATLRALHQLIDDPLVLDDPVVLRLLSPERVAWLRANPGALDDPPRRALRAFIALRSRYAEDILAAAVAEGVSQYVVLGAGLDTFAYRNGLGVHVFEVDHPATQAWKRERLQAAGITPPDALEFVAADFERQSTEEALAATRFDPGRPACVAWLGVTVYLTTEAIRRTLEWAASLASGSRIVFEYAVPSAHVARAEMAERSAAAGEPWITFFEPPAMAAMLTSAGFARFDELGPDDAYARYFRERTDGLRPRGTTRLVCARV